MISDYGTLMRGIYIQEKKLKVKLTGHSDALDFRERKRMT